MNMFAHERAVYPNLGGLLYIAFGHHSLAFIPEGIAVVWLGGYWWRRRTTWSWKTHGMVVLLVSVTCSYYSFPYDEIILLPAIIAAAALGNRRLFYPAFVLVNAGYAFFLWVPSDKFRVTHMFLSWTASAWLLTYLLSRPQPGRSAERGKFIREFEPQVAPL
jgi:hypothetical protein